MVKTWIIVYFIFSIVLGNSIIIYYMRERVKKIYYKIKSPEKIIKVVIHFKNNLYREYFRLIPDDNQFIIDKKIYQFDNKLIRKNQGLFIDRDNDKIKIGKSEYSFNDIKLIKKRKSQYMEIHYFYNNPLPIEFNLDTHNLKLSGSNLNLFKENDLFTKLLNLNAEKNMLLIVMFLCIGNLLLSIFIICKIMGWIK